MCYGTCPNEDRMGECTGRPYGKCPSDEGYEDAKDLQDYLRDEAADERAEYQREMREQEERHGIV